jgi:glycosyltransferase involved in cell wall biosynthesis
MSRRAATFASRVIATDRTLIPEITEFLGVDQPRIVLIPNAVHPHGPLAGTPPAIEGSPLLLSAGRLEHNKGFHILIDALAKAKLPEGWHWALCGDGSQRESLRQRAAACLPAARVSFVGALTDSELQLLLQKADLFVNPTLYEGSSIVTLEAMQAGLPVVASDTGGLPDKVIPNKNGWLVKPGDATALSAALETACNQREQWARMGQCSAAIVSERYTWDQAADTFLHLISSLSAHSQT